MGRNEIATFGRVTPDNQRFARAPRRAEREKARKAWLIPPAAYDVERSDDIPIREQEKVKQSVINPPPAAYDVERSDDIPIRGISKITVLANAAFMGA